MYLKNNTTYFNQTHPLFTIVADLHRDVLPGSIVVLTFNKDAKNELHIRGIPKAGLFTFHSFGLAVWRHLTGIEEFIVKSEGEKVNSYWNEALSKNEANRLKGIKGIVSHAVSHLKSRGYGCPPLGDIVFPALTTENITAVVQRAMADLESSEKLDSKKVHSDDSPSQPHSSPPKYRRTRLSTTPYQHSLSSSHPLNATYDSRCSLI